jgi:hypothetical protein
MSPHDPQNAIFTSALGEPENANIGGTPAGNGD